MESSPELQTHTSSCPSSSPPGCLLYFSSMQMTSSFLCFTVFSTQQPELYLKEKKVKTYYSFFKTYQVSFSSQWTPSPACCLYLSGFSLLPSPLLHQLAGLHVVPCIQQAAPTTSGPCTMPLSEASRCPHSTSHLYANMTCSVRLSFLHSPIEKPIFVPRHSTHLLALFLSIVSVTTSCTVVLSDLVHCCTFYNAHCMRTSLVYFVCTLLPVPRTLMGI